MKPIITTLLSIILCMILMTNIITKNLKSRKEKKAQHKSHKVNNKSHKKAKQVRVVQDNNHWSSQINQVTRRNPTLEVVTKLGADRLEAPSTILHMQNSNTSNGLNFGSFGKSVELVGKIIFIFIF